MENGSENLPQDRCEREMEQLAIQNYSAFIGSAEVTQGVKKVGRGRCECTLLI